MIDPPRIANLLSAGQHNLNYFVRKRKIKCVKVCILLSYKFVHFTEFSYVALILVCCKETKIEYFEILD